MQKYIKYTILPNKKVIFRQKNIEQETLELLLDAIRRLPERYQRIFELSFEQGLKNAEIAVILGVSESAVKKQKHALITYLRNDLMKHADGDFISFLLFLLCVK